AYPRGRGRVGRAESRARQPTRRLCPNNRAQKPPRCVSLAWLSPSSPSHARLTARASRGKPGKLGGPISASATPRFDRPDITLAFLGPRVCSLGALAIHAVFR